MARPKESEPSLGLDRRQLLAVMAAVTAAGTVPNADSAGATNSVQAARVTRTWVSENSALNVCASTARKIQEIVARNIIRVEARLPLLSVAREPRRMKNADDAAAFEEFADLHRQAVWDDVLASARAARADPHWRPRRFLDGLAYQSRVSKILRERFERRAAATA